MSFTRLSDLEGHGDWVTCVATTEANPNMLVSGSRDKTLLIWEMTGNDEVAVAKKSLHGHSHFVEDCTISSCGGFVLSGSWDGTLRLWEIETGSTSRRFIGHKKDVLSVAFSGDNRHIVSGSRDQTIKLWNTLGDCKFTLKEDGHRDWVSAVKFCAQSEQTLIISAGWDKMVRVWNLADCKLVTKYTGHTQYLNTLAISPDCSLCASGGKDGVAMLWHLTENRPLYSLNAESEILALAFSPVNYWLVAATTKGITVWNLEHKVVLQELPLEEEEELMEESEKKRQSRAIPTFATSLAWSEDGTMLFAGCTDNKIRVFKC
eukprot:TRINITY_DN92198_c2_g1_i1.p1 TRINITY_DN92198_c2_g1~~TRINITY_DN92198_c2_g1_i1.p1  ORF type:complete len:319 (+),score=32.41 TRINITY_DN92198_c2_g1_i1:61-1017(+)